KFRDEMEPRGIAYCRVSKEGNVERVREKLEAAAAANGGKLRAADDDKREASLEIQEAAILKEAAQDGVRIDPADIIKDMHTGADLRGRTGLNELRRKLRTGL